MPSQRGCRLRPAAALAAAAAAALAPTVRASFVPQWPTTQWLELTALRRPSYAYVASNLPLKTQLVPLAFDGRCGFAPPTRDVGCFPALLNWLYSAWTFDRTDGFLRLHSLPGALVTPGVVAAAPWGAVVAGTGLPGETLLARAFATTVRQRLPVCPPGWNATGGANASAPWCAWGGGPSGSGDAAGAGDAAAAVDAAALFGRGAATRASSVWRPPPPSFSGVSQRLFVDTPAAWSRAASPEVVAEGSALGGHLLFTRGLVHAQAAPGLVYPRRTTLQLIFAHPKLTVLAALVNATCYCPPAAPACWYAWLCVVLDAAVTTVLAPWDAGWAALSASALALLFDSPRAGFLTVAYHVLGPPVLGRAGPAVDWGGAAEADDGAGRRRLTARQRAASRRTGDAVNRRLAALAAGGGGRPLGGAPGRGDTGASGSEAGGHQRPSQRRRRMSLGEVGEQDLGGYVETDAAPWDADDALLWRALPGVLPLNSALYLAQLKDTLAIAGPMLLRTFSPLVVVAAAGGRGNASGWCRGGANSSSSSSSSSSGGGVAAAALSMDPGGALGRGATLPPDGSDDDDDDGYGGGGAADAAVRPLRSNESLAQAGWEAAGWAPLARRGNVTVAGAGCGTVVPARLIASIGSAYPCRPKCGACDSCTADCAACRAGGAPGGGSDASCAPRCGCAARCTACTACRWSFPSEEWRRRRLGEGEAEAEGGDDGAAGAAAAGGAAAPPPPHPDALHARRRRLWGGDCLTMTFTGTPRPFGGGGCAAASDPANAARTLCGLTDVETLTGVVHLVDRPLLPPSVLTALAAAGAAPFVDCPPPGLGAPPVCPFAPATDPAADPWGAAGAGGGVWLQ